MRNFKAMNTTATTTRMMRNARFWALLGITATLGACGGGGGTAGESGSAEPPPVFNAVDPSKVCPVGYVGWDFATGSNYQDIPKPIKIASASCNIPLVTPLDLTAAAKKACDGLTSCEFAAAGCPGEVEVKYTCGGDVTELDNRQPPGGGASQIGCVAAVGDGGAPALASPMGKACVPKVCPAAQRRDERMQCVADNPKPTIDPPSLYDLTMVPSYDVKPEGGGFAPNTDYSFMVSGLHKVDADNNPLQTFGGAQLTIWLVDRFERKKADGTTDDKDFVEGFRCEATKLSPTSAGFIPHVDEQGRVVQGVGEIGAIRQTLLSKECTDPRVGPNAASDAAIRAGLKDADFAAKYKMTGVYAHVSVDMENHVIIKGSGTGVTECAVNPPGFYYHPAEKYVDRIAYYQQRELAPEKTVVKQVLTSTEAEPTRIEVGVTKAVVRDPELTARLFGDDLLIVTADVTWYLAGDSVTNPYSPHAAVDGFANLTGRNLSATLNFQYLKPGVAGKPAEPAYAPVASVALPPNLHNPSGATAPLKFKLPKTVKNQLFDSRGFPSEYIQAEVCLTADGLDPQVASAREYPSVAFPPALHGSRIYRAGLSSTQYCAPVATPIHVTRDYTKRPLQSTSKNGNVALGKDTGTGDANASSTTSNDTERDCVDGTCTTVRHSGMTSGGILRGLLYDVVTNVVTKDDANTNSTSANTTAEALGFQIVDVDDSEQTMDVADKAKTTADGISLEITPNWDLIIEAVRAATGKGKTKIEVEGGFYGGLMGIGVGMGREIPLQIGPLPAKVTLSVSAGLSLGLQVGVKFKPDDGEGYPCIVSGSTNRCYGVVGANGPLTQSVAQGKCGATGGRLAEVHSLDDLQALSAFMDSSGAGNRFWLGAQMAYDYKGQYTCADTWNASCPANLQTSFRWLSDDSEFAAQKGTGAVTLSAAASGVLAAGDGLKQLAPVTGGIVYDNELGTISSLDAGSKLPAVCEYDAASAASYLNFSTGLHLGAGVGFGVSFCTPSEDLGVCVEGHLNLIDVSIVPEVGVTTFLLYRKDDAGKQKLFGVRGNTYLDVPLTVSMLSGSVEAVVNFFIGSASWTIVEYPGYTLFQTKLFEQNYPFSESY